MQSGICVSDDELKAFALGQLDEGESDVIAAHVSDCPKCEETLSGFDDTDDSVLEAVRNVSVSDAEPKEDSPSAEALRRIENPWTEADENPPFKSGGERIRDYELIERLGAGGMGTVYKAIHCRLDRIVALKTLPNRRLRDADAVSRFHREMKAIGRLDHPAIVRATDAGDDDGTHFIAMDFVDGIDLSQLVKLQGPIDVASACEIIRQAALGLQYAHEQGLIHRDVKPSNLMLTMTQPNVASVKLLDLGLALFGAASEAVDELTTVGQLMGTLDYMAPEQADNSHDVDARADVYSLGATLFKLLTGTAPYETSGRLSPLRKMKALATVDAPSVASRRVDLPADVVAVTDRMLLRDPAARFATANDVAEAIAPFCDGHRLAELTREGMRLRLERKNSQSAVGWPGLEGDSSKSRGFLRSAPSNPGHPDALENRRLSPSDAAREVRTGAFFTWKVTATLIAAMLSVLAFGFIIRLKTDTGTLVIECDSANVPIEIRQGKETVETLTVSNGANELTLRSGTYEIVLPKDIDSLSVDAGTVELRRGEKRIVKISEIANKDSEPAIASTTGETPVNTTDMPSAAIDLPLGDVSKIIQDPVRQVEFARLRQRYAELLQKNDRLMDSHTELIKTRGDKHPDVSKGLEELLLAHKLSNSARDEMQGMLRVEEFGARKAQPNITDEPVFEGKTFDQWKHMVETERSTSELVKAVDALGVLGKGSHDREVIETILKVIEQRPYAHPYQRSDIDAQLTIAAVRSVRAINPKTVAAVILPRFANRAPSVHEFILAGVAGLPEHLNHGSSNSTQLQIELGPYLPLKELLRDDEQFCGELCDLYDSKRSKWQETGGGYEIFGFSNFGITNYLLVRPYSSHTTDVGSTIIFDFIGSHLKTAGASERILEFLRKQIGNREQDSDNPQTLAVARFSALLLAEYSPDDSLAQIFVRAIEDDLQTPDPASLRQGGGFFMDGGGGGVQEQTSVQRQVNLWVGLAALGKHAEPSVPFLLKIIARQGHDGDDEASVKRMTDKYDEQSRMQHPIDNRHVDYYYINMRLLAIEIVARTGTKSPQAIELLRAEFQSLFGQQPVGDGSFEIVPGRDSILLDSAIDITIIGPSSVYTMAPLEIEMANSCLLAWKELTGEAPRFATDSLGDLATREWPGGTTTANMPKAVKRVE